MTLHLNISTTLKPKSEIFRGISGHQMGLFGKNQCRPKNLMAVVNFKHFIFLSKIYRQFLGRSRPGASVWDKGIYTACASLSKFSLHSSFPAPNIPLLLTKRKDGYEHKIMCVQFHGQVVLNYLPIICSIS
jgi:hypothetical protein